MKTPVVTWMLLARSRLLLLIAMTLSAIATSHAHAASALPYSDFFTAANPQHFGLTIFVSGIGAENEYIATHEGFELEQTLTPYIGLVGRVADYQIYQSAGWDTPLTDNPGSRPRNFGVFLGGIDILSFQGTSMKILGGRDVGDSTGARIEGDLSSWLWLHSRHPINLALTGDHFYNNGLSSGTVDIRTVIASSSEAMWLIGAGGQLWAGGSQSQVVKEFGPDLGVVLREWKTAIDLQVGYGNLHGYGTIAISRHFGWDEE